MLLIILYSWFAKLKGRKLNDSQPFVNIWGHENKGVYDTYYEDVCCEWELVQHGEDSAVYQGDCYSETYLTTLYVPEERSDWNTNDSVTYTETNKH